MHISKRREEGVKNVFEEIIAKNFPKLKMETYIQIQEHRGPKQDEPKQTQTKAHYN